MSETRLSQLTKAGHIYGERSFDNYAQIRSVAVHIRDGLCQYLDQGGKCVFLVPPQGDFTAQDYSSAAFSVAGRGFLPLEPISFGLAVKVSTEGDYMRLVMTCRKEGDHMYVYMESNEAYELELPLEAAKIEPFLEGIFQHLLHWFTDRVDRYDNGSYGSSDIGFDIHRLSEAALET